MAELEIQGLMNTLIIISAIFTGIKWIRSDRKEEGNTYITNNYYGSEKKIKRNKK